MINVLSGHGLLHLLSFVQTCSLNLVPESEGQIAYFEGNVFEKLVIGAVEKSKEAKYEDQQQQHWNFRKLESFWNTISGHCHSNQCKQYSQIHGVSKGKS